MFERYTEQARRVLFFARYEASQFGSPSIKSERLLLGLIRQGKGLTSRIFARRTCRSIASGRKFSSSTKSWDALCAEASAFATEVGRDRLITISVAAFGGSIEGGVVGVWYWG